MMTTFSQYQAALEALRDSRTPLFVLLQDADADAIGSAMALIRALEQDGIKSSLFCSSSIPTFLTFLLDAYVVENDPQALRLANHDLVVVMDAGSLHRTGLEPELRAFVAAGGRILNIDHHHVHEPFGTINLIDETVSATTVLIYDLVKLGGWTIDADIATAILVGIIADTDNFTNAGTTIRALTIAAECYTKGAEVRRVFRGLYRHQPLEALQLWGTILSRLQRNNRWGIVSTIISQEDFTRYDLSDEAIEGLADFLSTIANMNATLVLIELPGGRIKGSLRTTMDTVDVSKLAARFGGGGHRKAAGFTVDGSITHTKNGWRVE